MAWSKTAPELPSGSAWEQTITKTNFFVQNWFVLSGEYSIARLEGKQFAVRVLVSPSGGSYGNHPEYADLYLRCDIGDGIREYACEILEIDANARDTNKCFVLRITDSDLLSKTGGIVQGMSGSPVIQNGKLIGAVTHVFVNDPTKGYGIFIENMMG